MKRNILFLMAFLAATVGLADKQKLTKLDGGEIVVTCAMTVILDGGLVTCGDGSGGGFDPETLPGLARWGEPSTLPASGAIALWTDSSSAGNDATQAVEADKPTVVTLGGAKASTHTTDAEWLTLDSEIAALAGEEAFFAAAIGFTSGNIFVAGGESPFRGVNYSTNSHALLAYVGNSEFQVSASTSVSANAEGVYAWYRDAAGTWRTWKRDDGGVVTEITIDPATVADGQWGIVHLGMFRVASPFIGDIGGHIIAVGSALTDEQIESTINFLYESQGFL